MYFGPGNPQLVAFDEVQDRYTKNDNSLIVIEPTASDTAFNRDTLALAEELTDRAWGLIYSLRVDSVTNYQHTEADGDDLRVAPLIENATSLSDAEIVQVREIATTDPLLIGRLTSESRPTCLFYPSSAADQLLCVALRCRRTLQQTQIKTIR